MHKCVPLKKGLHFGNTFQNVVVSFGDESSDDKDLLFSTATNLEAKVMYNFFGFNPLNSLLIQEHILAPNYGLFRNKKNSPKFF